MTEKTTLIPLLLSTFTLIGIHTVKTYYNETATDTSNELFLIAQKLTDMIGVEVNLTDFAIHDYQTLTIAILQEIIKHHLTDFTSCTEQVILFEIKIATGHSGRSVAGAL